MTDAEFDRFICGGPNILVAPAGYGKTHTIAKSINALKSKSIEHVLVLTHTNAGITSIKEKMQKESVCARNVCIYTIAGFLQKIVQSLSDELIEQKGNNKDFYQKLYSVAYSLVQNNTILRNVIESSFDHIFIDEYQDCDKAQFNIIHEICGWNVKVHLLLDPLQTIFNFATDHPDYLYKYKATLKNRPETVFSLDIPYRWRNVHSTLESAIPQWRTTIENAIDSATYNIDLKNLPGITYHSVSSQEAIRILNSELYKNNNVLVLHSNSGFGNVVSRGYIAQSTGYRLRLVESIDNKDFYELAKSVDQSLSNGTHVFSIATSIFTKCSSSKKAIESWIKDDRTVKKNKAEDMNITSSLNEAITSSSASFAIVAVSRILANTCKIKVQRIELFNEILSAIESSSISGNSVEHEIEIKRNIARVQGRKLYGKVIGTTLLTKGLEADSVIILKPSDLTKDRKGLMHLYVALTRAIHCVTLIDYS